MFFSQQGVTNDSFPCNTVAGSRIGGNSKDRQRSSLCHEYHLFCVRQKELFKVAPAPFPLSTWGSTTPSVAVWAGKKRYFKLILYKKIMKTRSSSACHVGPLALERLIIFEQFWTHLNKFWTGWNTFDTFEQVLNPFEHIWTHLSKFWTSLNPFEHIWTGFEQV